MRALNMLLIIFACLFGGTVIAEEQIKYKDSALGVSLKEFTAKNKHFRCPAIRGERVVCISTSETYADMKVEKATATFINNELSLVELSILETNNKTNAVFQFMVIEDALSRRYGEPRKETDNLAGMERNIRVWGSKGERIQLDYSHIKEDHLVGVMIFRENHWENAIKVHRNRSGADI